MIRLAVLASGIGVAMNGAVGAVLCRTGPVLGIAAVAMLAAPTGPVGATPLLVEGKQTVYQRVLTRPHAELLDVPEGNSIEALTPFEPFYVFARQPGWIQAGRVASADPEGWIADDRSVEWKQNIIAAFTNPAPRSRQILFQDVDSLRAHMNNENVIEWHRQLLEESDAGTPREGYGVISVEPQEHIDIQEEFYIMPILGFVEELHPLSYNATVLMNVASLPLEEPDPPDDPDNPFDIGVVFAIDTTQSMLPHFEVMREQVQNVVSRMAGSELEGRVNFGIVAFRDDPASAPGLGYRVDGILPLKRRESQGEVLTALSGLEESRVSSSGFNEDSFAAVANALEETDWDQGGKPFGGRYIILLTDAGPKLPGQSGGTYDNTAADLQATAEALQTAILAIHLRTPAGAGGNHEFAEREYSTLTRFGGRDHYFPVDGGTTAEIAGNLGTEAQRLVTFLRDEVARADGIEPELDDDDTGDDLLELGRAIRLQYLGSEQGTAAPEVFDGWLSTISEDDGRRQALTLRLLLTRNELATMADLVEEFIQIGSTIETDEDIVAFHNGIRQAVLRMSQDPNRLVDPEAEGIGDAMEFLEDLPYQSVLLRTSLDRWIENAGERQVNIDGLGSKLRAYRRWLSSPDVWVPLFDDAPDSEWVTAMPVEFLP